MLGLTGCMGAVGAGGGKVGREEGGREGGACTCVRVCVCVELGGEGG